MKVTYTRKGDYLLPDLYLEEDENYGKIGRYGMLRLHFIAQNKQAVNVNIKMYKILKIRMYKKWKIKMYKKEHFYFL